ncbi:hypothetical protein Tco_1179051 [Tanacetum coccineum]
MSSQLVNIEKFSGKSNFSLLGIKIRALLKQQGIWAPIAGTKPHDTTDANYKLQEEKAHSTILLCLSDEVLYEVGDEETEKGEHLDALNSILMDLKNVEVKIEDEDAALVLLVSLPHSFESFVSSFVVGYWKIDCPKLKKKAFVAATAKDDSCYSGSECDLL